MSTILQEIKNWYSVKQDNEYVKSVFQTSGNCFVIPKLALRQNPNYYHIYLGYGNCNGVYQLRAFIIPENEDKIPVETKGLTSCQLIGMPGLILPSSGRDGIGLIPSENWVSNWMNDQIRNTWIDDCFQCSSNNLNDAIFQVFRIRGSDLGTDTQFYCYLALKPNPSGIISGQRKYVADIIVSKFGTTSGEGVYKDLAQPVPPYNHVNPYDFGLLNEALVK